MNANAQHHSDPLHRDPLHRDVDNTIDRALSALRDAQPRSGLEGRILTSLEHRTATIPGGPPFHKVKGWGIARGSAREGSGRTIPLALWTAASAAIIAIASLIILHHHATVFEFARVPQSTSTHPENAVIQSDQRNAVILSERSESKNPDTARHATNPEPFSTTNPARTTHTVSSRPERGARNGETCISDDHVCPVLENDRATTPSGAQALADLHAPSHPAPPLPLTPQEKLFLHMLRYGNATQLAELNPIVRAQQDADETTAFKAFFPDPPPLQQPDGDTE